MVELPGTAPGSSMCQRHFNVYEVYITIESVIGQYVLRLYYSSDIYVTVFRGRMLFFGAQMVRTNTNSSCLYHSYYQTI